MRRAVLTNCFGLAAILPLALNPSLWPSREGVTLTLCSADGTTRSVELPAGPVRLPGEGDDHRCAKACHGGGSRKKPLGDS